MVEPGEKWKDWSHLNHEGLVSVPVYSEWMEASKQKENSFDGEPHAVGASETNPHKLIAVKSSHLTHRGR